MQTSFPRCLAFIACAFALACSSNSSPTDGPNGNTSSGGAGADAGKDGEAPPGSMDASAPGKVTKRGVAYGFRALADLDAVSSGVGWTYNWSPKPDSSKEGVEFVPMVWGGSFDVDQLAKEVPAGSKYLLAFNEPNFHAQSNLTPQQAAALWPKLEAFAASRGMRLVSPAVNYCGGGCNETDPFKWLDAFFAACKNCRVDYVAFHWYACSKEALTWVLGQYETKYQRPVWLTEFSCLDSKDISEAVELQYMRDAVAVLEADPKVFRYAWFTGRFDSQHAVDLLRPKAGELSPLGKQYLALPLAGP
ncbi:glycoside hydrolase family protein [Pendulispora brunnea]|uniref:Glycoside hydrolase family protein n=1 Tax=Pendulispora brunnea TaxID=2905690 RepID=A0ABZ2K2S8_9BACT